MSNFNKVGRGTSEPNACGDHIRPVSQAGSMKQESPISGGECHDRFPTNVLKFSNGDHTEIYHPTQKPVELIEYLIRTYSNEGDTILDNCMGGVRQV